MQLYPKLSQENIQRLSNKYILDQVNARNFEIKNNTVFIKLNYHSEKEYLPVGKILGDLNKENIDSFVWFYNHAMKGMT
jgi:hypothetical protein